MSIQMVDLKGQYSRIKDEIDSAILNTISSSSFINGPDVKNFKSNVENYLNVKHAIPCANGTDALQIALMSLNLKKDDEIICPAFTYVATAEVIGLLGLKPVMAGVDPNTFNITAELIEPLINENTKVIVPVHLYGQSCDMEPIISLAKKYNLYIIEDNAQAFGCDYSFSNGDIKKTGTLGDIGTTSFFPSKNLGCFGDGGCIFTNNTELYQKMNMIANHGQEKKYFHKIIGCNSRLDSIQAAVLNVKLKYIDDYAKSRNDMAKLYDEHFEGNYNLITPHKVRNSTHVYHQYTLKIKSYRDELKSFLNKKKIPSMIYYPLPLYKQDAFKKYVSSGFKIDVVEELCTSVLSLPIHTEVKNSSQNIIIREILNFFNNN